MDMLYTGSSAGHVAEVVGYNGTFDFDQSRPDGTPRKLLDVSKQTAMGWKARTVLRAGLVAAYADFVARGGSHPMQTKLR
jgi:GDP-L-fucose synthase